jgi:methyl-accepting chemotaxis protein
MKRWLEEITTRSYFLAICGFVLGIMAPVGWSILRLAFFRRPEGSLWQDVMAGIAGSTEQLALFVYMGFGTACVLGTFGFLIGRAFQQVRKRSRDLETLNRTVDEQKQQFEGRFRELNNNIKSFHAINAFIQKSLERKDVLRLAADGLHETLQYDRVNILMVNKERKVLEFVASRGHGTEGAAGLTMPLDYRAGALFKTVVENRLFLVDDMQKMPDDFHLKPPCDQIKQLRSRNFILCPIVVGEEVVGLFGVDQKLKRKALNDTDVDTIKLFADQVSAALTKINLLEAVETLVAELETTFQGLLQSRPEHARRERALHMATNATSEAIGEISRAAEIVLEAVDTTRSSVGEISVSIDEVSGNIGRLNEFMEKSVSAMAEIAATVRQVRENSSHSQEMAEQVRQRADGGVTSVAGVVEGLRGIALAVDGTTGAVERLSGKSEEIGGITAVIGQITQKTSLLALNAAIIAAQAGEHGRAFGVVADEVRGLSQEAAQSTGNIEQLVQEIQDAIRETVGHIVQTRTLVGNGLALGEGMEGALRQIHESAAAAVHMAREIDRATGEISRAVEQVRNATERLGGMAGQVTVASREQAKGTHSIVRAVEEVRSRVDAMGVATDRQKNSTRDIDAAVVLLSQMFASIFESMEERQQQSRQVIERLDQLKKFKAQGEFCRLN